MSDATNKAFDMMMDAINRGILGRDPELTKAIINLGRSISDALNSRIIEAKEAGANVTGKEVNLEALMSLVAKDMGAVLAMPMFLALGPNLFKDKQAETAIEMILADLAAKFVDGMITVIDIIHPQNALNSDNVFIELGKFRKQTLQ